MIGLDLNEIKEKSKADEMLSQFKQEENQRKFYIIRIGKTEIKTTSSHRLKEYMELFPTANITVISNGE